MKSELSVTLFNKNKQSIKKLCAFTLAEILLSLSIIGIVAAIALPSLLGNVHERAFETQKKALYTRFSQSLPLLPSLNGYGTLEGTLSEGIEGEDGYVPQNVTVDTAAESFVRDGLSKVMKIQNICVIPDGAEGDEAAKYLSDCGLPDKITSINGSTVLNLSEIWSLVKFNNIFSSRVVDTTNGKVYAYEQLDTKAAAFETVNGESILVYYNPNCEPDLKEKNEHYTQPKMCANFVYDLNGKKGPNTVGKDIGFITAMYSTDPVVVAPNPYPSDAPNTKSFDDATLFCKSENNYSRLPNLEELRSMIYNRKLLRLDNDRYWSSIKETPTTAWTESRWNGRSAANPINYLHRVRCVKR